MADNAAVVSDSVTEKFKVAADELTYSGDAAKLQLMRLVHVAGAEGAKTLTEITDTTGIKVHETPATAGGNAIFHLVAAGTDNATNVKASAGQVYGGLVFNKAATPRYLKFHNTAGVPTAGAGVVMTVAAQAGVLTPFAIPGGAAFATGIGITMVTGIADNDTAAVTAADLVVDVFYK